MVNIIVNQIPFNIYFFQVSTESTSLKMYKIYK